MTASSERKPRQDAQRNRATIVATAARHIAANGVDASLDAIAKEAGVGPATLYRHFPSREALLAAVLRSHDDSLLAVREELRQVKDSGTALRGWLRALDEHFAAFTGVAEPLRYALDDEGSPLALTCHELTDMIEEFLIPARRAGHTRPNVCSRDLLLAVLATAWVAGTQPGDSARAAAVRDLLEHGYTSAHHPAASPEQTKGASTSTSKSRIAE
ncbi:TetR/AcrR family transcriptional regulator [Rhodococcus sp. T2V]|uniref:TetR/AcrR family transcriptional regulator n=1 Tax=Rhodococcus sp. T2V TaxID=3034164 RepID=UPI0023E125B1|nr:TetR/AcrR family transcriptional regulator [Rhodococcus sp. T2V]MDF3305313.1 TetR/AcrR family transcriptional regulator [Rhodococcus sp. T2V]